MVLGSGLQLSTSLPSLGHRTGHVQDQSSSDHICGLLFSFRSLMLWHQAAQASVPALPAIQSLSFHNPLGQRSHSQITPIAAAKTRALSPLSPYKNEVQYCR